MSYISIETLENIVPLDAQLGSLAPLHTPDVLREPLFGAPAPGQDAPKTYALIDPYAFGDVSQLDDIPSENMRSLYTGTGETEFAVGAPLLVALDETNKATRRFFSHLEGFPTNASVHFWARNAAIFVRANSDFDSVFAHFRRFTRIKDPDTERWSIQRFWDPRFLRAWLHESRATIGVAARLFGHTQDAPVPLIHSFLIMRPEQEACQIFRWAYTQAPDGPPLPANRTLPLDNVYRTILLRTQRRMSVEKVTDYLRGAEISERGMADAPYKDVERFATRAMADAARTGVQTELGWARFATVAASLGLGFMDDPRFANRGLSRTRIRQDSRADRIWSVAQGCIETRDRARTTSIRFDSLKHSGSAAILDVASVTSILTRLDFRAEWDWGAPALAAWANLFLHRFGTHYDTGLHEQAVAVAYMYGVECLTDPSLCFHIRSEDLTKTTRDAAIVQAFAALAATDVPKDRREDTW